MLSFREDRCTKYHEQLLYRGKVWVSVVPSLVNTHGDFVSLWLLVLSLSSILVCLVVVLCLQLCVYPFSSPLFSHYLPGPSCPFYQRKLSWYMLHSECIPLPALRFFALAKFLQKCQRNLDLAVFSVNDSRKYLSEFP